jgi:seryl-tRNA synthetase
MIDTKELRDRAATFGSDYLTDEEWVEVIDRLEAAEKSDAESIAMYRKARDERDALRAAVRHEADCVEAAMAEIKSLRAKIAAMERQEPVATVRINAINGNPSVDFVPGHHYLHHNDKLYLAPSAQPAPSAPEAKPCPTTRTR